jgi:hypothetical protein
MYQGNYCPNVPSTPSDQILSPNMMQILTNEGPMPKWSNHLTNVVLCMIILFSQHK